MDKNELPYFTVGENGYGGAQGWFTDKWMNIGGCAAVTACDSSIYFDLYRGTRLYPKDMNNITREDYIDFGMEMKPYLKPRFTGIDTLKIYINGVKDFLFDKGEDRLYLAPFDGTEPYRSARSLVKTQIDEGFPIPTLTLRHSAPAMADYVWHWYLITGYRYENGVDLVKVVTYGTWRWLAFDMLWSTGYSRKGGMVIWVEK